MKTTLKTALALSAALSIALFSASNASAEAFKSPSLGGATGLITTPTAHTGWEGNSLALDLGYAYLDDQQGTHIPKATLQIYGKAEIGFAYDAQDRYDNDEDMHIHGKFNFYNGGSSALAIGGNFQMLNNGDEAREDNAWQLYLAATYGGNFFNMPAETTIVIGKTFGTPEDDSVDFSMGFDLQLFPSIFKGYVHWINDFSNYSYSADPIGSDPHRGIFNTGARIAILKTSRYKWNVDLLMTDALDDNRDWGLGTAFGLAF